MKLAEIFKNSWVRFGLIISVILVLLSPLFSYAYEPLDLVAEQFNATEETLFTAPMPDYLIPILGDNPISSILAGIIGTLVVFFVALILGYVLAKPKSEEG